MQIRTYFGGRLLRRRNDSPSTNPSARARDQPCSSASTLNFSLDSTFKARLPLKPSGEPWEQFTSQTQVGKVHRRAMNDYSAGHETCVRGGRFQNAKIDYPCLSSISAEIQ